MKHEAYLLVLLCGVGDALTTFISLTFFKGTITESNANANIFFSTTILFTLLMLLEITEKALAKISVFGVNTLVLAKAGIVLVAFTPIINNLKVILNTAT